MDSFTLLAAANTAISMAKKGIEFYKEVRATAGDAKAVLDDLKAQFAKKPNPTNEEKRQYNEEVQRVQQVAKANPHDALGEIGENLGKFMDAYDAIIKLFIQEETDAKKVYKGEESIGRRALRRVLIRSRLDSMLAEIREQMVYNNLPELSGLWSKFEAMWQQIVEEQKQALAEEMMKAQIAEWQRRRIIRRMQDLAAWAGAILFILAWMWGVLLMIRMSQTYRGLSSYVWQ